MDKPLVIDTGVLVDIFLETRPRHTEAKKIGKYVAENRIRVKLPMHRMFELTCAIRNEGMSSPIKIQRTITEDAPLHFEAINIDEGFFSKYFDPDIPYLKAGDLIFVSLAKGDGANLITEDNNQYKVAKAAGVKVYRIKEFIDEFMSF
jgi:predicted nucleic acid-binding protein